MWLNHPYWTLSGVTVRKANHGIYARGASYAVLEWLAVRDTRSAGIALKANTGA